MVNRTFWKFDDLPLNLTATFFYSKGRIDPNSNHYGAITQSDVMTRSQMMDMLSRMTPVSEYRSIGITGVTG